MSLVLISFSHQGTATTMASVVRSGCCYCGPLLRPTSRYGSMRGFVFICVPQVPYSPVYFAQWRTCENTLVMSGVANDSIVTWARIH